MSRRIVAMALAASAALTATPAFSDRECFEDSCRVLEATVPPPPAAPQASAIPEFVPPETAEQPDSVGEHAAKSEPAKDAHAEAAAADAAKPQPAAPVAAASPSRASAPAVPAREASASAKSGAAPSGGASTGLAPASVLPKVIADPAPRQVPPQMSTRAEEARVRREPVRVAPVEAARTPKPAPAQAVRAPAPEPVTTVPSVRIVQAPQPVLPPAPGVAIIEVPGAVDTGEGIVTVYPNVRPDPARKVCQIDQRDLGRRAYRCTAASYHPYGEGGYRPYGDYRQYRTTPGYVFAPGAKIIAVDSGN